MDFFRTACDVECCGQPSTGKTGALPCCPSCSDVLRGDLLGLPFSLASCACEPGKGVSPRCCPDIETPQTRPGTQGNETQPMKDPEPGTSNVIPGIQVCPCAGGGMSTECCSPRAPKAGSGDDGGITGVLQCSCGPDKGFSTKCCPTLAGSSPQAIFTMTGPPSCDCGEGRGSSPSCCPSAGHSQVDPKGPESAANSSGQHFRAKSAHIDTTDAGLPIIIPSPQECDCGNGLTSSVCCEVPLCDCGPGLGRSPKCCRVAVMSASMLSELKCPCADGTASEECCRSSQEFRVVCTCKDGSLSEDCCEHEQAEFSSDSPPANKIPTGGSSIKLQLKGQMAPAKSEL